MSTRLHLIKITRRFGMIHQKLWPQIDVGVQIPEYSNFQSRPPALKRVWRRIRIAQIKFDLWFSQFQVDLMTADLSREVALQADLRSELKKLEQT